MNYKPELSIDWYKIFDLDNPNIKITNNLNPEDFKNVPIVLLDDEVEYVIGIADISYVQQEEHEIFSKVIFFKELDFEVEFFNYVVQVDDLDVINKTCVVEKVNSIIFKRKIQ